MQNNPGKSQKNCNKNQNSKKNYEKEPCEP